MQNVALSPSSGTDTASDNSPAPVRPFVSYTQAQILSLYKSPLVAPPRGMPILKDWFGYAIPFISFSISGISSLRDWNEQNASKKDSDTSAATSGARDKRCVLPTWSLVCSYTILTILSFRRDQEDAGTSSSPPLYPFVTHHLFSGASSTRHLPINVISALANGEF